MPTVKIVNVTRAVALASRAKIATSLGQRMKGLLGQNSLGPDAALILKPCASIHTFFMRFTIDVLFVDKNMRIIKAIPNMPAFRLSPLIWASSMAIELPAGKIAQTNTYPGDIIELQ